MNSNELGTRLALRIIDEYFPAIDKETNNMQGIIRDMTGMIEDEITPLKEQLRRADLEIEALNKEIEAPPSEVLTDSPLPWAVHGDSPENPPMIWDADGDAIVDQMPDGRPYFEPEIAAFIVRKCNGSEVEAALKEARKAGIEEAAGLQCFGCKAGMPVKGVWHVNSLGLESIQCRVPEISRALAEGGRDGQPCFAGG